MFEQGTHKIAHTAVSRLSRSAIAVLAIVINDGTFIDLNIIAVVLAVS